MDISWHDGGYYVSIPNYQGGMVYTPEHVATLKARITELENPFRAVDDIDWAHLDQFIPQSGHGKFWRSVFAELRTALSHAGPVARDGER